MILTIPHQGRWLLVVSQLKDRSSTVAGQSGYLADEVGLYWTGEQWSADISAALSFPTQREALQHRDDHQDEMQLP